MARMTRRVDRYDSTYGRFTDPVLDAIRKETFGDDIGQNSWVTVDEYERWLPWLDLAAGHHALEIASGSGGPALHVARVTGCRLTGIDRNEAGVATASKRAADAGAAPRVQFRVADATSRPPRLVHRSGGRHRAGDPRGTRAAGFDRSLPVRTAWVQREADRGGRHAARLAGGCERREAAVEDRLSRREARRRSCGHDMRRDSR